MSNPTYFVKDGHTLGYVSLEQPNIFCVLHGSVRLGGHNWKNGPVRLCEADDLVPATAADFERFRVSAAGHLDSLRSRQAA